MKGKVSREREKKVLDKKVLDKKVSDKKVLDKKVLDKKVLDKKVSVLHPEFHSMTFLFSQGFKHNIKLDNLCRPARGSYCCVPTLAFTLQDRHKPAR